MKDKKVLLFSGGIDSLASFCCLEGDVDVLLYIRQTPGGKEAEELAAESLADYFGRELKVIELPSLYKYEKENWEIPYRNLIFICLGKLEGDTVVLSIEKGTEHNESKDRSPEFFEKVDSLFSYMDGVTPAVINPVKDMTKVDEVVWIIEYLESEGYDYEEILRTTYSCYRGYEIECGSCPACIRKYLALKFWSWDYKRLRGVENWFLVPPTESRRLLEYFERSRNGYYTGRRAQQYLEVERMLKEEGRI